MKTAALVALLAGCSTFVRGPTKDQVVDCTADYVLPSLDVAAWAATVVGTFFAYQEGKDCGALDCLLFPGAIVADIALPLVAAHGFYKVHACRRARSDAAAQLSAGSAGQ